MVIQQKQAMLPAEALLAFEKVSKNFTNGVRALEEITLDVLRGEVTAVVGASGSGKTTLLRLAAGLERPTQGAIRLATPGLRRGYVFQQANLLPWATVGDNVALGLRLAGMEQSAATVSAVLNAMGLADKIFAKPHQLSGGQQMRVSLARALVADPELLLLDEPFAALDEITRARLCELVAQVQAAQQRTTLFVTHNLSDAVFLAQQVVLMRPGGSIAAQVRITGPQPRMASFRRDPLYLAQCTRLADQLAAEMQA